jgi:hypothetical protein
VRRLAGDSAFGAGEMLHWLVEEQKISLMFQSSTSPRDRTAPSHGRTSRMTLRRTPTCPEVKTLTTRGTIVNQGTTRMYRAARSIVGRAG